MSARDLLEKYDRMLAKVERVADRDRRKFPASNPLHRDLAVISTGAAILREKVRQSIKAESAADIIRDQALRNLNDDDGTEAGSNGGAHA